MKWITKDRDGEVRERRVFALLPISIRRLQSTETRWLCWVKIRERYSGIVVGGAWMLENFVDEDSK